MYCPKCGNELTDDSVYCNKCGTNISKIVPGLENNHNSVYKWWSFFNVFIYFVSLMLPVIKETSVVKTVYYNYFEIIRKVSAPYDEYNTILSNIENNHELVSDMFTYVCVMIYAVALFISAIIGFRIIISILKNQLDISFKSFFVFTEITALMIIIPVLIIFLFGGEYFTQYDYIWGETIKTTLSIVPSFLLTILSPILTLVGRKIFNS